MQTTIPFNKPYIAGKELFYIAKAVTYGNISGDGHFSQHCQSLLEGQFGIPRVLLTTSCTSALEMASMICDLGPGDEVIVPSYTFVSTVSAFVRLGAVPVFVDIRPDTLNIDESLIEDAVTPRTKAILPVHYAGVGCEMDAIDETARRHGLLVIEDAAQAVNAFYKGRPLGSIGTLGTFSFHETKNYVCGEGGALCINDAALVGTAEIIRDKGTDRQAYFRGEVAKYSWIRPGSSYVPSEILSAFLLAQLELLDEMAARRKRIYDTYRQALIPLEQNGLLHLPTVPSHCRTNHHMFYILLRSETERNGLMQYLRKKEILSVFHYIPLHNSPMGLRLSPREMRLPVTEDLSVRLLRLPFYYELGEGDQQRIVSEIERYLTGESTGPAA